jgi:hypothetical protein
MQLMSAVFDTQPFDASDMDLIRDTLGEVLARKAFWDNAAAFYRPARLP